LFKESYEPEDLFEMMEKFINLQGGIFRVDDTVRKKLSEANYGIN